MGDSELIFRLYRPSSPELEDLYRPISVEPVDALSFVESIIENGRKNAPDGPDGLASLTPRASCGDIKRLMNEEIESLLGDTLKALADLKATDHDV